MEAFWRAYSGAFSDVRDNPPTSSCSRTGCAAIGLEELFDQNGRLAPELKQLAPRGARRMSANPHANGGLLRKDLKLPDFRSMRLTSRHAAPCSAKTRPLGEFLRDVMKLNMTSFRGFGPDGRPQPAAGHLPGEQEGVDGRHAPEDADGGGSRPMAGSWRCCRSTRCSGGSRATCSPAGTASSTPTRRSRTSSTRCSTSTRSGWTSARTTPWRAPVASENILLSSTVWRQDHNGFSHQDPGFIDVVANKGPSVVRVYLPPDANTLLSIADHCLRSKDYINVIVADKQNHLQFTTIDEAIVHCTKGMGIWPRACTDAGAEPDVVLACCGDVATMEALAAAAILRERQPDLKLRFVNVVDLFKLQPVAEHPHGSDRGEFDSLFTTDKPIIFSFHGYPWLIHRLYASRGTTTCTSVATRRKGTSTPPSSWRSSTRPRASAW